MKKAGRSLCLALIACMASCMAFSQAIVQAEYFFDSDHGPGTGLPLPVVGGLVQDLEWDISTSGLGSGFHQLFVRFRDDSSRWSIAESRALYVQPGANVAMLITAAEFFFDTDPGAGNGTAIPLAGSDSINAEWQGPAANLSPGFHTLHIRVKQADGDWSIAESRNFYKQMPELLLSDSIVAAEYFIFPDPGPGNGIPFAVRAGMTVDTAFAWIANNLPLGNYNVGVRMKNAKGLWGFAETRPFRICQTYGPLAGFELVRDANKVSLLNRSEFATTYKWALNQNDTIGTKNPYYELPAGNYNILLAAENSCGRDTTSERFAVEGLKGVFPNSGGQGGKATVKIEGFGFTAGTTFRLVKDGVEIPADAAFVASGDIISAGLYLKNMPTGYYKLELQIPGKPPLMLDSAFRVLPLITPEISITVNMPTIIRAGFKVLGKVYATNRGNIDAYGVPIMISGFPVNSAVRLLNDTVTMPGITYEQTEGVRITPFMLIDSVENRRMIPLVIPRIGPSETIEIQFDFVGSNSDFQLFAASYPPLFGNNGEKQAGGVPGSKGIVLSENCGGSGGGGPSGPGPCSDCITSNNINILKTVADEVTDLLPFSDWIDCGKGIAEFYTSLEDGVVKTQSCPQENSPIKTASNVLSWVDFSYGTAKTVLDCASAISGTNPIAMLGKTVYRGFKKFDKWKDRLSNLNDLNESNDCIVDNCYYPPCPSCNNNSNVTVRNSFDPNEKIGPGNGNRSYIRHVQNVTYTVTYENADTAELPAQTVIVTDTLDVSKFNPKTVRFTMSAVGNKSVRMSTNNNTAIGTIDLRPAVPFIARINAFVDTLRGIIQWQVQTIDPQTGQETTDQLAGFLPPNDETHRGEGGFMYTVDLVPGLNEGDTLRNRASIVFDVNEPILTETWENFLDTTLPNSQVAVMSSNTFADSLTVNWDGTDALSGIDFYEIWVSENDGPFYAWEMGTTEASALFKGIYGNKYAFRAIATDRAGNRELVNQEVEAFTTFVLPPTIFTFTGNGSFKDAANWQHQLLPPAILPAGSEIVISPAEGGECVLDRVQEIRPGAKFTIATGKKLRFLTGMELK